MAGKTDPLLQADAHSEETKKREDRFAVAKAAGGVAFCCECNDQMMGVFLAPYFMLHGIDQAQVGICYFMLTCGVMLGYPVARALLKQYPPNKIQYYAGFGFILVRYIFGTLQWVVDDMLLPSCLFICLLIGSVASVMESGGGAWVMASSKPEDRTEAQAVLLTTRASGNMFAPFVGGALYSLGGFSTTFFVGGTLFLVYLILKKDVLLSYEPTSQQQEASQSGSILKHRLCLAIAIWSFLNYTLFFSAFSWYTPFFHFTYDCPIFIIGILMSSLVIPFVFASKSLPKLQKRFGYWPPVYMALLLGGLGNLFVGPSPLVAWFLPEPSLSSVWVPVISRWSSGIMNGVCQPVIVPLITNAAIVYGFDEREASSQASSFVVMQAGIAIGLGPLISGHVVYHVGVPYWNTLLSGLYLFLVIPLVYFIHTLDSKQAASATQQRRPSQW